MNKIVLLGRLTKNPELKSLNTGKSVATFGLAVNRRFSKDEADFFNCCAWEKTAEFITNNFTKGSQIAIIGRFETKVYKDKDGNDKNFSQIVIDEAYFAGTKPTATTNSTPQQDKKTSPEDFLFD
jgi:single-strand DNA-binding protein